MTLGEIMAHFLITSLEPLSSKPPRKPIGGTDRPEDLSEQSFDCDPPDRQSETSLADLDAR
jgi:hypothetical protein